jgi:beta-glucosidase
VSHSAFYLPAYAFGTGGPKNTLDFIGLNYYFREILERSPKDRGWFALTGEPSKTDERFLKAERSGLDWEIFPEGIYQMLIELKRYGVPLLVTENGICTDDDPQRTRFIYNHLKEVKRAIDDGSPVIGYQYWSLLDNFEWAFGFKPRFGLIHVDYATQKRTVKPSAEFYAHICRTGELPASAPVLKR